MKKLLLIASFILVIFTIYKAWPVKQLDAPTGKPFVQPVTDNWSEYQENKIAEKETYIGDNQEAFDWFADYSFSQSDGTPLIILKLLPIIAPELWGSEDNFLDAVGLFKDTRQATYPLARGIGISGLAREDAMAKVDYTSFTCAACHIGRVMDENNNIHYLDGGVNTEFNIVAYRVKIYQTLQKVLGGETDLVKQQQLLEDAFLNALTLATKKSDTYFYNEYKNDYVNFDVAYEQNQIELFIKHSGSLIGAFSKTAIENYTGYAALLDKNYDGFQARSLEGFAGMADATGIFTVNSYNDARTSFVGKLFSYFILPSSPGITDFMSVWRQDERKAKWDDSHQTLINGGGQWNGNIPIPMYRNMAAQLTIGLDENDLRVSAFSVDLLDKLPASVYPFDVDVKLAKKGEALFAQNCAQCHQPFNGKVYSDLGVNLDRSKVVSTLIRKGGISAFSSQCSTQSEIELGGKKVKPCAQFDGVSLEGKEELIMSPNNQHHGYNARPLSGIWAQAPYLHNGSVPTIYHLLVPNERPNTFIKSQLTYDQMYLGYQWERDNHQPLSSEHSYVFDTKSFATFSNKGHDTDVIENGQIYKLNWSDDKDGAMAIIEYLKTL